MKKEIKIYNQFNASEMLRQNRKPLVRNFYQGSPVENLKAAQAVVASAKPLMSTGFEGRWSESQACAENMMKLEELHGQIRNAANPPDQATLESFFGRFFLDVTRRAQEAGDLTTLFNAETTNPNFPEVVYLRDLQKFIGKFKTMSGTNDTVPLIDQKTGNLRTMNMVIRALGWKTSFKNLIYNDFFEMAKVMEAVADADADQRNADTIGTIVGTTFHASQKQAADATSGASFDVKVYNTIRKAVKKLRNLKDPQTGRKIVAPRIHLLCNSLDAWDLRRAINGDLQGVNGSGDLASANLTQLPIDGIIEYDQGRTDGFTWGKDTLSFPGVTAGKCYIFVPEVYSYTGNKRLLTMEMGRGSVLELGQEERAWYRVYGTDMQDLLGSSAAGASSTGEGAIVEVSLPSDS